MYNIILNPLSQFEIIDFFCFEASLIDNIHISFAKIGLYVILSLVFIMILTIFIENLNRLVSNKLSISKESMYVTIIKGLLIHGLTLFSVLVLGGCAFALLPFLVGLICNYLDFSLQVVKLKTKFCSSNSGVGNALTARDYSTLPLGDLTHQCSVDNFKLNPWWFTRFVDGSYLSYSSKLLTTRYYSAAPKKVVIRTELGNSKLDPNWITGLVDAEGCFRVSITKNKNYKLGWEIEPRFQLNLHVRDQALLEGIKNSLRVGQIYKHGPQSIQFVVTSRKDLGVCIKFFLKYKLQTQKRADCELWIQVCEIIERCEHLSLEGLRQIVAIRASMNRGLSDELSAAFPGIVAVVRPLVENPKIHDLQWLAGFVAGEGSFMVKITASQTHSVGFKVQLVFQITQHERDEQLIRILIEYLHCGIILKHSENAVVLIVTKFRDIVQKIIPLFQQHPIKGVKYEDFKDFCLVAEMMKEKKHLTQEGLEQIRKIKDGMNRGRKLD